MASAKGNYPTEAFLYVLGVPGGPFKVGYSYSPQSRRNAMLRAGHAGCYVVFEQKIGVWQAQPAERYAHWLLRDHHLQSEWFNVSEDEAIAAVREAVRPDRVAAYTPYDMIPDICAPDSPLRGGDAIKTKFPKGTKDRLRALLGTEGHSDFIRAAVEAKLTEAEGSSPSP